MGIAAKSATARISLLRRQAGKVIAEKKIPRRDALEGLSDEELQDVDSVLQIAYFLQYRQAASSRAERTLGEVVKIIEQAAADIEGSEHRSEEALARAEAAVGRMTESHRRAMPRLGTDGSHKWFKQFNKY